MNLHGIEISPTRVAAFCRANGIRRLALFGPVLRDDFQPRSDIHVWLEFQPGLRVGLSSAEMQDRLSSLLGHGVHLTTPDEVTEYYRNELNRRSLDIYRAP
jgi:predicted nucleotidyltransferase